MSENIAAVQKAYINFLADRQGPAGEKWASMRHLVSGPGSQKYKNALEILNIKKLVAERQQEIKREAANAMKRQREARRTQADDATRMRAEFFQYLDDRGVYFAKKYMRSDERVARLAAWDAASTKFKRDAAEDFRTTLDAWRIAAPPKDRDRRDRDRRDGRGLKRSRNNSSSSNRLPVGRDERDERIPDLLVKITAWVKQKKSDYEVEFDRIRYGTMIWNTTPHRRLQTPTGFMATCVGMARPNFNVRTMHDLLHRISSSAYIKWGAVEKKKALTYEIDVEADKDPSKTVKINPSKTIKTVLAEALWRLWNRLVWTDEDVYESTLHDAQIIQELEWATTTRAMAIGVWTAEERKLACYFASLVSPPHDDEGMYLDVHLLAQEPTPKPTPGDNKSVKKAYGVAMREFRRQRMQHNIRFPPTARREFMKTQLEKIEELFKIVYNMHPPKNGKGFPGWPAAEQRVDHMPRLIENYGNPTYLGRPVHVEAVKNRSRYNHPIHNYEIQPHWELRIVRKSGPVPEGVSEYNWVEYQGTTGSNSKRRNVRLLDPRQTIANRHPTTLVPM